MWDKTDAVICRICAMCPSYRNGNISCGHNDVTAGKRKNSSSPDQDSLLKSWTLLCGTSDCCSNTWTCALDEWLFLCDSIAYVLLLMTEINFLILVISAGKRWLSKFCTWSTYCTFKLHTPHRKTLRKTWARTHTTWVEPLLFKLLLCSVRFFFLLCTWTEYLTEPLPLLFFISCCPTLCCKLCITYQSIYTSILCMKTFL